MPKKSMRRRDYRHKVQVQALSGTTSAGSRGQVQKTFSTVETTQAAIRHLKGQELLWARELYAKATHEVELDYTANVTPTARLKFGSRFLNIGSVDNLEERNRTIRLLCDEVV